MAITLPELHVAKVRYLKFWDAWLLAKKKNPYGEMPRTAVICSVVR